MSADIIFNLHHALARTRTCQLRESNSTFTMHVDTYNVCPCYATNRPLGCILGWAPCTHVFSTVIIWNRVFHYVLQPAVLIGYYLNYIPNGGDGESRNPTGLNPTGSFRNYCLAFRLTSPLTIDKRPRCYRTLFRTLALMRHSFINLLCSIACVVTNSCTRYQFRNLEFSQSRKWLTW